MERILNFIDIDSMRKREKNNAKIGTGKIGDSLNYLSIDSKASILREIDNIDPIWGHKKTIERYLPTIYEK